MKKLLLQIINEKEEALDLLDAEGHIWWNKFRELVQSIEATISQLVETISRKFSKTEFPVTYSPLTSFHLSVF